MPNPAKLNVNYGSRMEVRTRGRNTDLIIHDLDGNEVILSRQPPETKEVALALQKVLEHYRVFHPNRMLTQFIQEFIIP